MKNVISVFFQTCRVLTLALLGFCGLVHAQGVSHVSFTESASSTKVTSLTFSRPANVTTGDLLIAVFVQDKLGTISAPTGWTTVFVSGGTDQPRTAIFWRAIGTVSSEPTTYTFTSSANEEASGGISAFRGVDTTTPIDVIANLVDTSSGNTLNAPSITTTVANTMLVGIWGSERLTITKPASMTESIGATAGSGRSAVSVLSAYQTLTAAGATGVRTAGLSANGVGIGVALALRPKPPPSLSIANASLTEGNSAGSTNLAFTVTSSATSTSNITVTYTTAAGTATAGTSCTGTAGPTDYITTTGTATIAAGSTSTTFSVPVCGDTVFEPDETFTVTLSSPSNATIGTGSATGTIVNDDFQVGGFAVYETAVADATAAATASATVRYIKTRVASASGNLCQQDGATCSLRIAALASGAVSSSFNGSVVATLQSCNGFTRLGTTVNTAGCTWTDLNPPAPQSLNLANGVGNVTFTFSPNVYAVVRVKIASAALGITSTSDDFFAIRPARLALTASDASATTAGSTRLLTSGANTHQAMRPFTLTATGQTSSATTTTNYPGSGTGPTDSTTTELTIAPSVANGGVTGVLSVGNWSVASGVLSTNDAKYTEAGTFSLTMVDDNYADIDRLDGQSSATDRQISGSLASVGRFTPAFFTTAVSQQGCSANGFTYSGQPFTTVVTAKNYVGNTTVNYFGTAGAAQAVTLSDANGVAGSWSSTSVPASDFLPTTKGQATVTRTFTFTSPNTLPRSIRLRVTDSDNVSSSTGTDGTSATSTEGTTTIYSGRIRLLNANGSELLPLSITARVENYVASGGVNGWYTSTVDSSCSTLAASNFAFSFPASSSTYTNNLSACTTGVSSADFRGNPPAYSVRLKAPGTGKAGWTDLTLNLGSNPSGTACTCTDALAGTSCTSTSATTVNLPWLQFNWSGSIANPTARSTFGVSKSGPTIHLREMY